MVVDVADVDDKLLVVENLLAVAVDRRHVDFAVAAVVVVSLKKQKKMVQNTMLEAGDADADCGASFDARRCCYYCQSSDDQNRPPRCHCHHWHCHSYRYPRADFDFDSQSLPNLSTNSVDIGKCEIV